GSIARLHEDGQSSSAPRSIADGISTWQHLCEVLHFVCELRGIHAARQEWMPDQVCPELVEGSGMTNEGTV
ncbi:MAG: hypothetical protein KKA44_02665, partial [Alphaproteobacteria bacterium]|nr:hypothetical protein [Alphaproteobacteria bacterium]